MTNANSRQHEKGLSLVEVTIATGLLAAALSTLGHMLALSVSTNRAANTLTYTSILAEQKMQQLRGLTWGYDSAGQPVSDTTSNTAASAETSNGGTGLSPSPAETMTSNMSGWVDYLDRFGNVLGGGGAPLPKTVYIRRWAIEPLASSPATTILIHVLVTTRMNRGSADSSGSTATWPGECRLVSVKTRKAQ